MTKLLFNFEFDEEEKKSQSDSAINKISVDTNFLTAHRMVTEDPRGAIFWHTHYL